MPITASDGLRGGDRTGRSAAMPRYKLAAMAATGYLGGQSVPTLPYDRIRQPARYCAPQASSDTEEPWLCQLDTEMSEWRAVPVAHDDWKCAVIEWREAASAVALRRESLLPETLLLEVLWELGASVVRPRPASESELSQEMFERLARQWREETATMPSVAQMAMHPAYQRIIGMGPKAVPLILRELERRSDHWFWALTAITGENPASPEDAGDIQRMRDAWLKFGVQRGYL